MLIQLTQRTLMNAQQVLEQSLRYSIASDPFAMEERKMGAFEGQEEGMR